MLDINRKVRQQLKSQAIKINSLAIKTPQEAFSIVLKECNGYIRGLGLGPKPPKKTCASANEVRGEIGQIQQVVADRESELRAEIERLKKESVDRENKLRQESIERENKLKEESIERENKLRADIMAELKAMMHPSA